MYEREHMVLSSKERARKLEFRGSPENTRREMKLQAAGGQGENTLTAGPEVGQRESSHSQRRRTQLTNDSAAKG